MSTKENKIIPNPESLSSFIERIERLADEKKALALDIASVFSEAKSTGFDVKAMREVLKLRAMDRAEREQLETLTELYLHAVGM